jgi:hypothetical protein
VALHEAQVLGLGVGLQVVDPDQAQPREQDRAGQRGRQDELQPEARALD